MTTQEQRDAKEARQLAVMGTLQVVTNLAIATGLGAALAGVVAGLIWGFAGWPLKLVIGGSALWATTLLFMKLWLVPWVQRVAQELSDS